MIERYQKAGDWYTIKIAYHTSQHVPCLVRPVATPPPPFQHRSEVFFDARYMTKDTHYRICHDNEDGSCSHTFQGFLLTPWNANECGESHKLYYNIPVGTYCENNLGPSRRKRSLTDINGRNFTLANDHCAVLVKIDDDWVVSHKKSVPTVVDQTTPNADSGCQLFEGAFN